MTEIRPISHQSTNDKVFALVRPLLGAAVRVADVGAGEGYFSKILGDYLRSAGLGEPSTVISACDVVPENFKYTDIVCDPIESSGRLPYADGTFDVVCSLEVVEHVQDQFAFTRELARVLRPGGVAIVSTPNVLNINSRVRILHSGFAVLFDPLSLTETDVVHTSGHIHPISYYYLAYAMYHAGFGQVDVVYDRHKTSARMLLALLAVFTVPANAYFRRRIERKRPQIAEQNRHILRDVNSTGMLTARSVIAVARKGPPGS